MSVSVIEQAKIQAEVLVPLVKALQAELGTSRANALVRNTLGPLYRRYGEEFWRSNSDKNLGSVMGSAFASYARDGALDYDVLEQSDQTYAINVTRCKYAEFYREINEPELGFLFVCSADFDVADGLGAGVRLARSQTIMQGASHCDFRYTRQAEDK